MASKNIPNLGKQKVTVASSSTKLENQVVFGPAGSTETITLKGVKDGFVQDPTDCGLTGLEHLETTPFTTDTAVIHAFPLSDYRGISNVDTCLSHLSKSKEIKQRVKKENVFLTVSKTHKLIIVKQMINSDVKGVVSFNKACAIMSAAILRHKFDEVFDWSKKEYVPTGITKVPVNDKVVNRLAGQMGLTPDSPFYWMIVPGYEFLYEFYPAEVLAYTLVRMEYQKQLKIPDSMSKVDIINSLVMKMNRLHNLEVNKITEVIKLFDRELIEKYFHHLAEHIGITNKTRRNADALKAFIDLVSGFSTVKIKTPQDLLEE